MTREMTEVEKAEARASAARRTPDRCAPALAMTQLTDKWFKEHAGVLDNRISRDLAAPWDAIKADARYHRAKVERLAGVMQDVAADCDKLSRYDHIEKGEARAWASIARTLRAALAPGPEVKP